MYNNYVFLCIGQKKVLMIQSFLHSTSMERADITRVEFGITVNNKGKLTLFFFPSNEMIYMISSANYMFYPDLYFTC